MYVTPFNVVPALRSWASVGRPAIAASVGVVLLESVAGVRAVGRTLGGFSAELAGKERDLKRFCTRGLYLDGGALVLDEVARRENLTVDQAEVTREVEPKAASLADFGLAGPKADVTFTAKGGVTGRCNAAGIRAL